MQGSRPAIVTTECSTETISNSMKGNIVIISGKTIPIQVMDFNTSMMRVKTKNFQNSPYINLTVQL